MVFWAGMRLETVVFLLMLMVGAVVPWRRCTRLRDEQFIAAAESVAKLVSDEERSRGLLYPPLSRIREVSAYVAKAVAQKAYEGGFGTEHPKPYNLLEHAQQNMYTAAYKLYR